MKQLRDSNYLLSSSKTLYIVVGVFIFLYITVLAFYILPTKVTPVARMLFNFQWYVPIVLFIPVYIERAYTRTRYRRELERMLL